MALLTSVTRLKGTLGQLMLAVLFLPAVLAAELVPVIAAIPLVAMATPMSTEAPEYNAKAGYLLTFMRYVEWPAESFPTPGAPVVIGVLGTNPFGDVLEKTVRGIKVQGRPIEVRFVATVEEAANCHVVFIARKQERNEAFWLQGLCDKPILTITESSSSVMSGAVLSLFVEKNLRGETKPFFSASLPAAHKAGLQLSAELLQFARKVYRDPVKTKSKGES